MVAPTAPKQLQTPRLTPQEYLEQERVAEAKSEYLNGEIVAMAGASPEHNAIAFNLATELGGQLGGGNCRGFASDLRIRVPACNRYYYPDLTVLCGEPHYEERIGMRSLLNPTLIIEVLSDSTEANDRGEKFICYQTLASVADYLLVSQHRPRIERFTRQADGSWRYIRVDGLEATLLLETIGCELRFSNVYTNVEFPPDLSIEEESN